MEQALKDHIRERLEKAPGFREKIQETYKIVTELGANKSGTAIGKTVNAEEIYRYAGEVMGISLSTVRQSLFIERHGTEEDLNGYETRISHTRKKILKRRKAQRETERHERTQKEQDIKEYALTELKKNLDSYRMSIGKLFRGWEDVLPTMDDAEIKELMKEIESLISYLEQVKGELWR